MKHRHCCPQCHRLSRVLVIGRTGCCHLSPDPVGGHKSDADDEWINDYEQYCDICIDENAESRR